MSNRAAIERRRNQYNETQEESSSGQPTCVNVNAQPCGNCSSCSTSCDVCGDMRLYEEKCC